MARLSLVPAYVKFLGDMLTTRRRGGEWWTDPFLLFMLNLLLSPQRLCELRHSKGGIHIDFEQCEREELWKTTWPFVCATPIKTVTAAFRTSIASTATSASSIRAPLTTRLLNFLCVGTRDNTNSTVVARDMGVRGELRVVLFVWRGDDEIRKW